MVVAIKSLQYLEISFEQALSACTPALTAVLGFLIYGKRENICVWLALLPVVGGAALLVRGEPKVNIHGVDLVFTANFLRAVKVFCKRTSSKAVRRQD